MKATGGGECDHVHRPKCRREALQDNGLAESIRIRETGNAD